MSLDRNHAVLSISNKSSGGFLIALGPQMSDAQPFEIDCSVSHCSVLLSYIGALRLAIELTKSPHLLLRTIVDFSF
jgi:hypothetical protein